MSDSGSSKPSFGKTNTAKARADPALAHVREATWAQKFGSQDVARLLENGKEHQSSLAMIVGQSSVRQPSSSVASSQGTRSGGVAELQNLLEYEPRAGEPMQRSTPTVHEDDGEGSAYSDDLTDPDYDAPRDTTDVLDQFAKMRRDLHEIREVRREMDRVIKNQCKPELVVGRDGARRFAEDDDGRVPQFSENEQPPFHTLLLKPLLDASEARLRSHLVQDLPMEGDQYKDSGQSMSGFKRNLKLQNPLLPSQMPSLVEGEMESHVIDDGRTGEARRELRLPPKEEKNGQKCRDYFQRVVDHHVDTNLYITETYKAFKKMEEALNDIQDAAAENSGEIGGQVETPSHKDPSVAINSRFGGTSLSKTDKLSRRDSRMDAMQSMRDSFQDS